MPELQDTKDYIAATEKKTRKIPQRVKRDANYELPQPYGRAKDAHNVSRNDLSRLCKYDPLGQLQYCIGPPTVPATLQSNCTRLHALRDPRLARLTSGVQYLAPAPTETVEAAPAGAKTRGQSTV